MQFNMNEQGTYRILYGTYMVTFDINKIRHTVKTLTKEYSTYEYNWDLSVDC